MGARAHTHTLTLHRNLNLLQKNIQHAHTQKYTQPTISCCSLLTHLMMKHDGIEWDNEKSIVPSIISNAIPT